MKPSNSRTTSKQQADRRPTPGLAPQAPRVKCCPSNLLPGCAHWPEQIAKQSPGQTKKTLDAYLQIMRDMSISARKYVRGMLSMRRVYGRQILIKVWELTYRCKYTRRKTLLQVLV